MTPPHGHLAHGDLNARARHRVWTGRRVSRRQKRAEQTRAAKSASGRISVVSPSHELVHEQHCPPSHARSRHITWAFPLPVWRHMPTDSTLNVWYIHVMFRDRCMDRAYRQVTYVYFCRSESAQCAHTSDKNSSGDEIANVNFYAVRPEATRIRWNNAK